jgi:hypothetical protein
LPQGGEAVRKAADIDSAEAGGIGESRTGGCAFEDETKV